jgi:hypothetical protein
MPNGDDPTTPYSSFEQFLQSGACRNRHEAESIWAYWRNQDAVALGASNTSSRRFLRAPTGDYEELGDFPNGCIQPQKAKKHEIFAGYFDLLAYEHAERCATHRSVASLLVILVCVIFLLYPTPTTALVVSLVAIVSAINCEKERKRIAAYRIAVERQLRGLGICTPEAQLPDELGERSDLGQVHQYPTCGLGVVWPVRAKDQMKWGDRVFALFDDKVYK